MTKRMGKLTINSDGADGVLAPGSAHTRPSAQPPIDNSGICLAQVSRRGVKKIEISGDSKHFSEENTLKN